MLSDILCAGKSELVLDRRIFSKKKKRSSAQTFYFFFPLFTHFVVRLGETEQIGARRFEDRHDELRGEMFAFLQ